MNKSEKERKKKIQNHFTHLNVLKYDYISLKNIHPGVYY